MSRGALAQGGAFRYGAARHYAYRRALVGAGVATAAGVAAGYGSGYEDGRGSGSAAEYCANRYRSYDPQSGTYLGNDGRRHACC